MTSRFARIALACIMGAGTFIIGARLGAQSLWIDEAITLVPVTEARDAADLVTRVRAIDTQPPASHALLYALRELLPRGEFGWRLPSLLAVEVGVLLLALVGGRLYGPAGLLFTGLCAQVSPFLLFYAMEARNYALWFLAVAAAAWSMTGCLQAIGARSPGRTVAFWTVAWGLANTLGLWTHLFHLFALVVQATIVAAIGLVVRPPRPVARAAALATAASLGASLLLFLPWILLLVRSPAVAHGVGWTRRLSVVGFFYFPFAFVFGFSLGPDLRELHQGPARQIAAAHPLALLLAAAALALLVAGLWSGLRAARREGEPPAAALFLLAPAVGILGPALYVATRDFPLVPRHLMFLWPLVPLLQAFVAVRPKRFRAAVLAVAGLQAIAGWNLLFDPVYAKDDERGAIRFAEEHSGARPLILGDAAPLYARNGGLMKMVVDPRSDAILGSGATDIWLVDNRAWEDPAGNVRDKVGQAAGRLGLVPQPDEDRFRGIVLRHWAKGLAP